MNNFNTEVSERVSSYEADQELRAATRDFMFESFRAKYSYNFFWLGRPIIQYPQDVMAMQDIIWRVRPDLIIETGIAHGGSLVLSASMLALLDYCEAVESGQALDPRNAKRKVLAVDIDIRSHNRDAIMAHPMSHRIDMIQGSSIDPGIVERVYEASKGYERILVCLDSNHTHAHVLSELKAYAPLTSMGSYCCVFDTVVEDLPDAMCEDRPWGKGDNPKTAVREYLRHLDDSSEQGRDGFPLNFEIDNAIEQKLQITVSPEGYLKRI